MADPVTDLIARLNSGGNPLAHLQAWAEENKPKPKKGGA